MRDTGPWKCSLVTEENELAESTFDVTVFTPAEVDFGARPFRFVMIIPHRFRHKKLCELIAAILQLRCHPST